MWTIARNKSMFWHGIWKDRGKMQSGVINSIMKKTRSTYHYMLRALKKKTYYETKISLSKSMLQSNGKYWKSARVLRKNNYSCINVVDGVRDDSQIAKLIKDKYERLFNSVQCSEYELKLMETQVESDVVNVCNNTETCESSNCVHYHIISSDHVSTAIGILKTDKVNDNVLIY